MSVALAVGTSGCQVSVDDGGAGGASGGDDGPATVGATTTPSATQAATSGAGTNGPCGGVIPLASADAIAATPRADAAAELLAIEASGTFVASDALYARVTEELAAIREMAPETASIQPRSPLIPAVVFLRLEASALQAVVDGQETTLGCVSKLYGADAVHKTENAGLPDVVHVNLMPKVLDTVALAEQLGRLPGVLGASGANAEIDGSDVCLHAEGDAHVYIFDHAGGDCPSGCTEHVYSGFRVLPGEAPERLGDFDPYLDADPTWFRAATRCQKLL